MKIWASVIWVVVLLCQCRAAVIEATVDVENSALVDLYLSEASLVHGEWTVKPPPRIDAGASVSWKSESDGIMTGTEGSVRYVSKTENATFIAHWDIPFVGSNSCDGLVYPDWRVSLNAYCSAGSGDHATFSVLVNSSSPSRQDFLIFGHAGAPNDFCENTFRSWDCALSQGANGLELDLSLSKEGNVVVIHDWDPDWYQAEARQAGLEGYLCRPWVPDKGSSWRRPTNELTVAEIQQYYGYTNISFAKEQECRVECHGDEGCLLKCAPPSGDLVPTLDDFLSRYASDDRVERFFFDTKVPEGASNDVIVSFISAAWNSVLQHPPAVEKVLIGSPYPDVHKKFLQWVRENAPEASQRCFYDQQIPIGVVVDPLKFSSMAHALDDDVLHASIGRPVVTVDGWKIFTEIIRYDVQLRNKKRSVEGAAVNYIAWTINKENEMKELLGMTVDSFLTDDIPLLKRVLQ